MRIKKYEPGSFFKIDLDNGWHAYARIAQVSPYIAIYNLSNKDLIVDEVKKSKILFVVCAFDKEIGKECKRIGYFPLEPDEITLPLLFRQMPDMGKYWVVGPYDNGIEVTKEACIGLEHAGLWYLDRLKQRLIDYQNGVPNFDLEYFKLK